MYCIFSFVLVKSNKTIQSTKLPVYCKLECLLLKGMSHNHVANIQLAMLDHNFQEKWMNKKGEVMYQRKYRKQSIKWDVTSLLAPMKYDYIPDLFIGSGYSYGPVRITF